MKYAFEISDVRGDYLRDCCRAKRRVTCALVRFRIPC